MLSCINPFECSTTPRTRPESQQTTSRETMQVSMRSPTLLDFSCYTLFFPIPESRLGGGIAVATVIEISHKRHRDLSTSSAPDATEYKGPRGEESRGPRSRHLVRSLFPDSNRAGGGGNSLSTTRQSYSGKLAHWNERAKMCGVDMVGSASKGTCT